MGNLRNTKGLIIKIRARDRNGRLLHKNEFSTDDEKRTEGELRTWRDKLGVSNSIFKKISQTTFYNEDFEDAQQLVREKMQDKIKRDKEVIQRAFNSKDPVER